MSYSDSFASVYDAFTENVEYDKRADYVLSLLKNGGITNGILLDAACGTGNFISRFCEKSKFDMIGVDISSEMLSVASDKLKDAGRSILLLCQDICDLDLYGTVDCAVCMLDSVNHLIDIEDVADAFKSISLFLRPGGLFVFDVNTEYKHRNILSGSAFAYENENAFLVWQNSECDEDGIVDIMLDIFSENKTGKYDRSSEDFSERAYPLDVLTELLAEAGLDVEGVYSDLSMNAPDENDERVYFVAKKAGE